MATAAPHVKLLRQLASAKDDYLSGAFDISWDGAKATLYLVFGRPSHAVFDTDQAQIEGEAAIDALLAELPRTFAVSDWRRAMSPHETLSISIDELAGPFVRLAGSYADDPVSEENPEWWTADDSSPDLGFGLSDFPLLPGGRPLWAETSPENVNLAERLAELPPSILILTGAKLRAAAVVSGGDLIDAVWIDDEDQARGEAAGMAILGATKGTLAGYALDDPRVAEALTMLWRLPLAVSGIEMSWLDPASMLAAFRADGLDRVLVIDAPVRGIALFSRGGLVAVYSETQRSAVASPERLRSLLSQARGRLTVMERKPRPVGATAARAVPSATDFFGVLVPEAPEEVAPDEALAVVADAEVESPAADAGVETAAVSETDATAETVTTETEPAEAAGVADASAVADGGTTEPVAEQAPEAAPTDEFTAEATSEHPVDAGTLEATNDSAGAEAVLPPPPPPDAEHAPPPPEDALAVAAEHTLPPPAPDDVPAEPERKPKRAWRLFGGSKKNKAATPAPTPETIAAEAATAHEAAEAADSSGWHVRQPNPEPVPVWQRARDFTDGSGDVADGSEPPPPAAESVAEAPAAEADAPESAGDAETPVVDAPAPVSSWSVVEPGTVNAHATSTAPGDAADTEAPADAAPPAEAPSETEAHPEAATSRGWSARDVLADSVGWYRPVEAVQPAAAPGAGAEAAPAPPVEGEHVDAVEATDEDLQTAAHDDDQAAAATDTAEAAHDDAGEAEHLTAEADDATPHWYNPQPVASDEHEAVASDQHEAVVVDDHDVAGESNHAAMDWYHPQPVASDEHEQTDVEATQPVAAADESPADAADHEISTEAAPARDFWAEFASPDPDAVAAATTAETDEPVSETDADAEPEAEADEPAAAAPPAPVSRKPSGAPWSWPLAEADPAPSTPSHVYAAPVDEAPEHVTASAVNAPADDELEDTESADTQSADTAAESDGWEPVFEGAGDQSFFQRDEPVGSQFVDFDEVRTELVQIGIVWLGEANAVPVTALLRKTRSTIDDFVATIDTIRGLHLEGQDPASVQAMAREMHQQAAERLCGA
jgi:hypothetical protein